MVEHDNDPVSSEEMIWAWIRQGYKYRIAQGNTRILKHKAEYVERTNREMKEIIPKDFVDYFLATSDIVRFAKDSGIPVGPGRGSAASSLVLYWLRITEIDPLAYPLMMFERFIAPDREDIPDIDLDFDDERRHEVREYAVSRYGADRVANVGTYHQYKGRNAIDDIIRVHRDIPKAKGEAVKEMLIDRSQGDSRASSTLEDTVEMFPQAKEIFEEHPDLWKAARLEGNYRGMSTHSAGLVVTNTPISDICAMYTRTDTRTKELLTAVSVNKYDAEYLGLMKMDFLGLTTMGMIRYALEYAGMTLEELYKVPMDDEKTLAAFTRNDVIGIFQFEGRAARLISREVKPSTFQELADISGLARPGPMFSGTTAEYIRIKRGEAKVPRFHPIIDRITSFTQGQVIYQEQVLQALAEFGGLPVTRVHEIRKIISQKLGEAQFNASMKDFVANAQKAHKVKKEVAEAVWGRLVTSASYSFNIAHAVSYSMLGFWTMYLKQYHPVAFYTASLRKVDDEKWGRLIKDAERHGVKIRGVVPGVSGKTWTPGRNSVLAGYTALAGVGDITADKIVEYAKTNKIKTADDLINISGIGPKSVEAFRDQIEGDDPFGLLKVRDALDSVREALSSGEIRLRRPTVKSHDILDIVRGKPVIWLGLVKMREYKDHIEDERARFGREIEEIKANMKSPELATSCTLHGYDDGDEEIYLKINRFDFPKFAERLADLRVTNDKSLGDVVWVRGRRSKSAFGLSLYVESLIIIDPDEDEEL